MLCSSKVCQIHGVIFFSIMTSFFGLYCLIILQVEEISGSEKFKRQLECNVFGFIHKQNLDMMTVA